jgi:hypothetical protein
MTNTKSHLRLTTWHTHSLGIPGLRHQCLAANARRSHLPDLHRIG